MLSLVIVYLIIGLPATLLYAWLEYKRLFPSHVSFWREITRDLHVLEALYIYVFWPYYLIMTILSIVGTHIINGK